MKRFIFLALIIASTATAQRRTQGPFDDAIFPRVTPDDRTGSTYQGYVGTFDDTVQSGKPFVPPDDRDDVEVSEALIRRCMYPPPKAAAPAPPPDQPQEKPAPLAYTKVDPSELPAVETSGGDLKLLKQSLERTIANCKRQGKLQNKFEMTVDSQVKSVSKQEYCIDSNTKLLELVDASNGDMKKFMEKARTELDWYKPDCKATGHPEQFTGYHAPMYEASRVKTKKFKYPIYKTPDDLVDMPKGSEYSRCQKKGSQTVCPYEDRTTLIQNLKWKKPRDGSRNIVIGYVADPLEVALLHIQGSGALWMHEVDGRQHKVRVNYDNKNGRQNNMPGKVMRCMGYSYALRNSITVQKEFFKKFRKHLEPILAQNLSYVFMSEGKDENDGPYGETGVVLTDEHSLAADQKVFPGGTAILFQPIPRKESKGHSHTTVGNSADIGSAILGCHLDVYKGEGEQPAAETMNDSGSMFMGLARK